MRFDLQEELLDHLSVSEWKLVRELIKEIGAKRNAKAGPHWLGIILSFFSQDFGEIFSDNSPSVGAIYAKLEILEDKGWVEKRPRNVPHDESEPSRHHRLEWRLTQDGKRRRVRDTSESKSSYTLGLAPTTA